MASGNLILDRYRPLGEAGTGGFGAVVVAWDPRIQRKVAIKTIELTELDAFRASLPGADAVANPNIPSDDPFALIVSTPDTPDEELVDDEPVRMLAHLPGLDEARTAAMLDDPRIVTVYDFEVRDRTAYLIMEYVEGITLTQFLHEYEDYLTLDVIAAVFEAVAGALRTAHAAGVLHLDIKPDNILINAKGEVKVTDFGLATLADAAGLGTTGGGTIGYMPLEQMRREHLDARCDEWSLASVLYEMLTGENPFIVPSLDQAEAAIENAELVLPSLCWEDLDEQIDDVVFFALDPDREERYASVKDFADEARKFLGKPDKGTKLLAAAASDWIGEIEEEPEDEPYDDEADWGQRLSDLASQAHVPLSERVSDRMVALVGRLFAAVGSGFLGYLAASNIPAFLSLTGQVSPIAWGFALAAAVLGAFRSHLGALFAFILLGAALIMGNSPLPGIVLIGATIAWWYFVGRKGMAEGNVGLAQPIAGAVGCNVLAPLTAGAALRPAMAVGAAAFACVTALVMAAFGAGNLIGWDAFAHWRFARIDVEGRFVALLMQPATWCIMVSWIAAAWAEAFVSNRGGRTASVLGAGAGMVIAIIGALAAAWFDSGQAGFAPSPQLIVPIVAAAALLVIVAIWIQPDRE